MVVAAVEGPEAEKNTPVETPPRKKRGRPPKNAASSTAKRRKTESPSMEPVAEVEPKTPVKKSRCAHALFELVVNSHRCYCCREYRVCKQR